MWLDRVYSALIWLTGVALISSAILQKGDQLEDLLLGAFIMIYVELVNLQDGEKREVNK